MGQRTLPYLNGGNMEFALIQCLACGAPQDSNLVRQVEWNCEYCRSSLHLKNGMLAIGITKTPQIVPKLITVPEDTILSFSSIVYLLFFIVLFGAWAFFNIQETYEVFTIISYVYLFIFTTSTVKEKDGVDTNDTPQTILSVILWILYSFVYFCIKLPNSIFTQIPIVFIVFISGEIVGNVIRNYQKKQTVIN